MRINTLQKLVIGTLFISACLTLWGWRSVPSLPPATSTKKPPSSSLPPGHLSSSPLSSRSVSVVSPPSPPALPVTAPPSITPPPPITPVTSPHPPPVAPPMITPSPSPASPLPVGHRPLRVPPPRSSSPTKRPPKLETGPKLLPSRQGDGRQRRPDTPRANTQPQLPPQPQTPPLDEHKFLFIAGVHRSGTTITHAALRDHPDISGFKNTKVVMDEGQFLTKVLPTGKTFGGFSKFAFDSRAHLTEAHHLNTKENSDQLFADWSRYWNLSKPVLMEKSPPHTMQLRLLNALFKDKGERYFLVVQRHPVATTLAIMFWGKKPRALTKKDEVNFWSLIEHWLIQNERMREDATFLDNVVVVRYEEFMAYPQDYLLYLHRWLGVKPDPLRQKLTDSTNDKYYNALLSSCNLFEGRQGVCNDKTIRYTSINSRSKYQELKERVESFGYSMEDPFSLPEVPCSGKLLPHERLWCDRLITPTMLLHGPTK